MSTLSIPCWKIACSLSYFVRENWHCLLGSLMNGAAIQSNKSDCFKQQPEFFPMIFN